MYIYYNMLQERYREYNTAGKLFRRLWMDFPNYGTHEHTFYVMEQEDPNMRCRWIKGSRPTVDDIKALRVTKEHIKCKVFFLPGSHVGWQNEGEYIHIWWADEPAY